MDINDLTPELKEKAAKCSTPEELLALAKDEGYELSDEEVAGISGSVDWSCNDQTCDRHRPIDHS